MVVPAKVSSTPIERSEAEGDPSVFDAFFDDILKIYLCRDNSGTGYPLVAERAFGQPPFSYVWAHDVISAYLNNSTAAFASVVTRGTPAHSHCLPWILANLHIRYSDFF